MDTHICLSMDKITRLYAIDTYISGDLLNVGVNNIAVTLNSHGHDTWTYRNRPIMTSVTIDTRKDD